MTDRTDGKRRNWTVWGVIALWLLTVGTLAGDDRTQTSSDVDAKLVQGTWELIYQESRGGKLPDEEAAAMFDGKALFKGNRIRYTVQLPHFDFEFAYKLDPTRTPKTIDLTLTDVDDQKGIGRIFRGIYQLDKDSLKICYSTGKRPTGFGVSAKSTAILIVLERKRPTTQRTTDKTRPSTNGVCGPILIRFPLGNSGERNARGGS
jgi:uncharacterized protein (TIGR03067 family)